MSTREILSGGAVVTPIHIRRSPEQSDNLVQRVFAKRRDAASYAICTSICKCRNQRFCIDAVPFWYKGCRSKLLRSKSCMQLMSPGIRLDVAIPLPSGFRSLSRFKR